MDNIKVQSWTTTELVLTLSVLLVLWSPWHLSLSLVSPRRDLRDYCFYLRRVFVGVFVCPRLYHPLILNGFLWNFAMRFQYFMHKKYNIGQRSRSPKTIKKTLWVITFEPEDISLLVDCKCSYQQCHCRYDVRRTVFASRDVKWNIRFLHIF